jgi:hypothetical protein
MEKITSTHRKYPWGKPKSSALSNRFAFLVLNVDTPSVKGKWGARSFRLTFFYFKIEPYVSLLLALSSQELVLFHHTLQN